MNLNKEYYTTREVGVICHVSLISIISWIEQGELTAHKTLGGHRRVMKEDLIEFLKKNNFPIPEELTGEDKYILKSKALRHIDKTKRMLNRWCGASYKAGLKNMNVLSEIIAKEFDELKQSIKK